MSERTSYVAGTPSWIDLQTTDTAAAATFYAELFGWRADFVPDPAAGGYGMFSLHDQSVAGVGPRMDPSMPPTWTVYVTVDNADETASAATTNGGQILAQPMDVLDAGRMAVLLDPSGAHIAIWQPKGHIGSHFVNEPGTFVWNQLATPDITAANAFYSAVFGWGVQTEPADTASAIYTVDGEVVCGAHTAGPGEPVGWSVWLAVGDCDASTAVATAHGATVVVAPNDMGFGRGAVLADPQGAVFGIGSVTMPEAAD